MKTSVLRSAIFIGIALLVGYYVGVSKISFDWKQYKPTIHVISKEPPASLQTVDLSRFWLVLDKLEGTYYDKTVIDSQKIVDGAINGMVESLGDPYTMYLPASQNTDFKNGMAGQFEGIGAELGMRDKQIVVVSPLDAMPAQRAGVQAGDAILKVGDEATTGWTLSLAVEKIRGPKNSQVALTILHKDGKKPVILTVTRGTITVKSVTSWIKKVKDIPAIKLSGSGTQEVAYIRLSQFGDNTNKEWLPVVNDVALKMKSDSSIQGVILDLRNNPGGYLTDASYIASEFIDSGVVVTEDKGNGETTSLTVNRQGLLTHVPVVVLINKGSASASEIVAGALRDHKRATLVGETSFGKGTVQEAEDLGQGAGIHITIAKWLTPNGTWVHKVGLKPDISVAYDPSKPESDPQLQKAVSVLVQ